MIQNYDTFKVTGSPTPKFHNSGAIVKYINREYFLGRTCKVLKTCVPLTTFEMPESYVIRSNEQRLENYIPCFFFKLPLGDSYRLQIYARFRGHELRIVETK